MKKVIIVLFAVLLILSLTGCDDDWWQRATNIMQPVSDQQQADHDAEEAKQAASEEFRAGEAEEAQEMQEKLDSTQANNEYVIPDPCTLETQVCPGEPGY